MLKLKIEMAVTTAMISSLLYSRDKMTWEEVLKRVEGVKEDLYNSIASMEPTHESEII